MNNVGAIPLHDASENGHLNVVKILLANDANVNASTIDGETALQVAEFQGHTDIVQMLKDVGAK